ncbi:C-terminal processing peptidase, chloroplastic [Apostasia shenzhenica]|uniref:C-terminal processing peptidase n=1 Tax=Apostasia shenzhenica TaxID=1088818 RepID=A0A2I0BFM2_9ASPA|nr:C-terminal processing peptidase, chloroplastic [Apostasia shenzhenica]
MIYSSCSRPFPLSSARTEAKIPSRRRRFVAVFANSSQRVDANHRGSSSEFLHKILLRAIAGALSVALVYSDCTPPLVAGPVAPPGEVCREADAPEEAMPSASVKNEDLVEEAWEVVNDSFLGEAGNRDWSPEKWLKEKEYIFQNSIQTRSRAHNVIRKMLASLGDPYTRFLSPAEFSKMARYDMSGIGINLREVPDHDGAVKIKVLGVILDGPAHSAGVRQGDELLSVNGLTVRGKSAFEVSSMLQGPKETFVTIEVRHGDCGQSHLIKVQRHSVARTPVFYHLEKMEKGDISVGYIHIKEFNALARKDLIIALKNLLNSGASYLVLDLRDNPGGLVQAGIEVAKLFLDKGETVIYTVGRDPEVQDDIIAEGTPFVTNPVIVLVNNRTASASEIVASALRDNCKAVLVGEKTYGKGLIQSVYELHDGSGVVVTIGKYVTPNHVDINRNGIQPDFSRFPGILFFFSFNQICTILVNISLTALIEVAHHLSRCHLQRLR